MSTAVNEILKQVERLSTDEQLELAAELNERLERQVKRVPDNGCLSEAAGVEPEAQIDAEARLREETEAEARLHEEAEEDEIPDVFSLNRVPPKRTYTMRVKYKFVGRGKPRPYPLEDEE